MKLSTRLWIAATLATAAAVAFAVWWNRNMEKRVVATPVHGGYDRTRRHLALQRFLERQGIEVETRSFLGEALPRMGREDAIFLSAYDSRMPEALAGPLMAWIDSGGTALVQFPLLLDTLQDPFLRKLGFADPPSDARREDAEREHEPTVEDTASPEAPPSTEQTAPPDSPTIVLPGLPDPATGRRAGSDPTESDSTESDSVASAVVDSSEEDDAESGRQTGTTVRLPGMRDSLRIEAYSWSRPVLSKHVPAGLEWVSPADSAIAFVSRGEGLVVVDRNTHRFGNHGLRRYDHAEFLLRALSWKRKPAKLWIVTESDAIPWWKWLWSEAAAVLVLGAALTGLWLWNRARRFGPALPDPEDDHRPILEHVDAGARWIWNAPEGPQTLLSALRDSARRNIALRHPGWARLPDEELSQELSRHHGISARSIRSALGGSAGDARTTPQEFVRKVKLLQKLKEKP